MAGIPEDLSSRLAEALRGGDAEEAEAIARQLIEQGVDPLAIVADVLVPTLTGVGEDFQEFRIFLPELMMAGEAAGRVTQVVEEATLAAGQAPLSLGTVVLGQVQGDLHDIGRNIVGTLLKSHGFKVVDLGRDVPPSTFLAAAEKEKADIVALSALMTTTLPAQRRTLNLFTEVGARDQFTIIVGGGAVSQGWAEEIGADGFASDAAGAVALCKRIMHAQTA
jgi:5-methyltetrahydrofolate--homocysteine methyltransferase